jgi:Fe-S-cluster-containing dehydrogenase component
MSLDRRDFLQKTGHWLWLTGAAALAYDHVLAGEPEAAPNYQLTEHWWGMIIDVEKCIGCGNCVRACKEENDVPHEPFYFRTWVERYHVPEGELERPVVDSPNGGADGFPEKYRPGDGSKNFFVPKLCNQCAHSPCVQVCPVGATFEGPDGVVLVDKDYCLGCRYCVQACPYGCRFIDPRTNTVDKCTLCYHRITRGMLPACVQSCPKGARIFGDLKDPKSEISTILRQRRYRLLKPEMGTHPKCFYIGLDREVI